MGDPGFEYFEHTADVGIVARGRTLPEAFANACRGLLNLVVESGPVGPLAYRDVEISADGPPDLLVQWLNEILFLFDSEGFIVGGFAFSLLRPDGLRARVWGELFDPARHRARVGVKAATYHQASVVAEPGGYVLRAIVDV